MCELKKVNYIIVHHSASDISMTFEQIKAEHINRGWSDIGYHKVIDYKGNVFQGRKDTVIGAQTYGMNKESLGICCIGNFENIKPSEDQYKNLVQVSATLLKRYGLKEDKLIGHRDVAKIINDSSAATACPGKNLSIEKLRNDVKKYL